VFVCVRPPKVRSLPPVGVATKRGGGGGGGGGGGHRT